MTESYDNKKSKCFFAIIIRMHIEHTDILCVIHFFIPCRCELQNLVLVFVCHAKEITIGHVMQCLFVSRDTFNRKSILFCMLCYSFFIPCRCELQNLVLVFVCHAKEITIGHVMQCLFVSHNTFNRKSILLCMLCYSFFILCRCELQNLVLVFVSR